MKDEALKVLFVCSGNSQTFEIAPFVKSQAISLEREGVVVDFFLIKGKGLKGYLNHIKPLRTTLKNGSYDLVHAHYTFCGWVSRFAGAHPLVVSYMGSDTYGSVDNRGRWKIKSLPVILQGMLLNFFVSAIIVKSENLKRFILLKNKARVIPNGVDFEVFKPIPQKESRQKLNIETDQRIVLFLGNPADGRKNFRLAEQANALLEKELQAKLLTPFPAPPSQVPYLMNAADLLLITSFLEGSPNVVKEAMACNCPVVATDSGDIARVIEGTTQCHLAKNTPEDLAEKLRMVLKNGGRSDGRSRIQHLGSRNIALEIIHLYRKLIAL